MADPDDPETTAPGMSRTPQPASATDFDARFQTRFELARGGMGRVLVAQDVLLHREVAVKELLRNQSVDAIRRFEREALLTARLQHPGIVSVYEFGRRVSGEPVLVMRRVEGKPFEQAIAQAKTLDERLALLPAFISACDAVAYAHQQGVIHRDLKPGNVLLGSFGDTVVIDWGLAKDVSPDPSTLDPDADVEVTAPGGFSQQLTMTGAVMGTPAYMSPEQARGEKADARTDVYALGAMLYQLLSGRIPYVGTSSHEIVKAVRAGPPKALVSFMPEIAPELLTIASRAMARDAVQRYPTAGELAEELKRFQAGRLVLSHAYTTRQLVTRWARRHAASLAVAAVAVAMLAALGALGVRRILAERNRANREAEVSRRVSDFVTGMFSVADPGEARGNSVTAREILDNAASEIDSGLSRDPLIQARLMGSIGAVYSKLGLYSKADPLLRRSLETQRALLGPENADALTAALPLSDNEMELGRRTEAEGLLRTTLDAQRRALGPEHPDTLRTASLLARVWHTEERLGEAEPLLRSTLAAQRRVLGPEAPDTLRSMIFLSDTLRRQRKLAEAEKLMRELLEVRRRLQGPDHPATLSAMQGLASVLNVADRPAEAEPILRQLVEAERRLRGPDHPRTLDASYTLATSLWMQNKLPEAESIARQTLAGNLRAQGPDHPDTLYARQLLSTILMKQGKGAEAETDLLAMLEFWRRKPEANRREIAQTLYNLGCAAALQGKRAGAIDYLRQSAALKAPQDVEDMATDEDLKSLRGDPAFEAILARARALPAPAR